MNASSFSRIFDIFFWHEVQRTSTAPLRRVGDRGPLLLAVTWCDPDELSVDSAVHHGVQHARCYCRRGNVLVQFSACRLRRESQQTPVSSSGTHGTARRRGPRSGAVADSTEWCRRRSLNFLPKKKSKILEKEEAFFLHTSRYFIFLHIS